MERSSCACRSELVWDGDLSGTAESPLRDWIRVGEDGAWTPRQLISVAIQTSLMIEFLRIAEAAGVEVLGYLSSAAAGSVPEQERGPIQISPCIVLSSERDLPRAQDVLERARERSWICGIFGGALELDPSYFVAPARAPA